MARPKNLADQLASRDRHEHGLGFQIQVWVEVDRRLGFRITPQGGDGRACTRPSEQLAKLRSIGCLELANLHVCHPYQPYHRRARTRSATVLMAAVLVCTSGVYHWYMPLPRFYRLPAERQRVIVDAAKTEFAQHGPEAASYNTIIAKAGISKSSAYQYFDGKDDILGLVLSDVSDRLRRELGSWVPADTVDAFWQRLSDDSARLVRFLEDNPLDRALADAAVARIPVGNEQSWLAAVIENGISLGVIRSDVDRDLLSAASAAVLRAGDQWALAGGGHPDQIFSLLAGLWGPPHAQ